MSLPLTDRLVSAGSDRIREEIRDARDRFIASDPGWSRLRTGMRAIVAVATTLALMAGFASWLGQPLILAMLLGAVIAMLMSTGIRESRRSRIAETAAGSPVVAAIGVSLGVLTAEKHLLGLVTFVVVSFVAVWVRRFGMRWFTFGFLLWQGFFFALFLHPALTELPFLLAAVGISGVWVGLLLLTVLYDDPESKLRRIVGALRARARAAISAAVEVLDDPQDDKKISAMRRQLVRLREIALLLDGQLADARALPEGVRPGRLRRWTVDIEIGMDEVCGATLAVARQRSELPPDTIAAVERVLETLGWAEHAPAWQAANELVHADHQVPAVRRLAGAAIFMLDLVILWDTGLLRTPRGQVEIPLPGEEGGRHRYALDGTALDEDPLDEEDDFEPVVTLIGGNLPGSAALAEQSIGRENARRLSPSRMRLTTRQAVQAGVAAGLAILVGEAISTQRFYWAVIATFVGFAGTATSGETLSKGVARIGGTLVGLVAAVALANVTAGHHSVAIVLILVCIFCAFFLQPVFYSAMIFFITVMLGQLYTLLGTFSDELLLLRLAETAAGAAIGVLVSLLVLPAHSRATLRVARKVFLANLADLLEACSQTLAGGPADRDLLTLTVQLDASGRQVVRTRKALSMGRLFGADRTLLRHRMSVLGTCGASARAVAGAISPQHPSPQLAEVCAELAEEARRLGDAESINHPPPLPPGRLEALDRVRPLLDQAGVHPELAAVVHSLRRLSDALGLLSARPVVAER